MAAAAAAMGESEHTALLGGDGGRGAVAVTPEQGAQDFVGAVRAAFAEISREDPELIEAQRKVAAWRAEAAEGGGVDDAAATAAVPVIVEVGDDGRKEFLLPPTSMWKIAFIYAFITAAMSGPAMLGTLQTRKWISDNILAIAVAFITGITGKTFLLEGLTEGPILEIMEMVLKALSPAEMRSKFTGYYVHHLIHEELPKATAKLKTSEFWKQFSKFFAKWPLTIATAATFGGLAYMAVEGGEAADGARIGGAEDLLREYNILWPIPIVTSAAWLSITCSSSFLMNTVSFGRTVLAITPGIFWANCKVFMDSVEMYRIRGNKMANLEVLRDIFKELFTDASKEDYLAAFLSILKEKGEIGQGDPLDNTKLLDLIDALKKNESLKLRFEAEAEKWGSRNEERFRQAVALGMTGFFGWFGFSNFYFAATAAIKGLFKALFGAKLESSFYWTLPLGVGVTAAMFTMCYLVFNGFASDIFDVVRGRRAPLRDQTRNQKLALWAVTTVLAFISTVAGSLPNAFASDNVAEQPLFYNVMAVAAPAMLEMPSNLAIIYTLLSTLVAMRREKGFDFTRLNDPDLELTPENLGATLTKREYSALALSVDGIFATKRDMGSRGLFAVRPTPRLRKRAGAPLRRRETAMAEMTSRRDGAAEAGDGGAGVGGGAAAAGVDEGTPLRRTATYAGGV